MRSPFGEALRGWRSRRRQSQLDLALSAGVSPRHLAFLETGRSHPSRAMVLQLAEALAVPLQARNQLLERAGFTPEFQDEALRAPVSTVRQALAHLLARHDPFPALVFDRRWTVVDANAAGAALLDGTAERNLVRWLVSPEGRTRVENWEVVAADLRARLRTEASRAGPTRELSALSDLLGPTPAEPPPASGATWTVRLRVGDHTLALTSMLAEFAGPRDLGVDDLRIELFFPADEPTRRVLTGGS